jgi:hypothetical protein
MARPGGNPDLKQHQFSTKRTEPLEKKITIRITASMLSQLEEMEDYREFIRQAIVSALEQREK